MLYSQSDKYTLRKKVSPNQSLLYWQPALLSFWQCSCLCTPYFIKNMLTNRQQTVSISANDLNNSVQFDSIRDWPYGIFNDMICNRFFSRCSLCVGMIHSFSHLWLKWRDEADAAESEVKWKVYILFLLLLQLLC